LKVFVNIIPEWYVSVNYFHLCQQCNKLYIEATIPFLLCIQFKLYSWYPVEFPDRADSSSEWCIRSYFHATHTLWIPEQTVFASISSRAHQISAQGAARVTYLVPESCREQ